MFDGKRQEALEKMFGCKFIRINTSKEGYDAHFQAGRIQTFISKFKDRQLKKLSKKLKELEDKIKKFVGQITQQNRSPSYKQLRTRATQSVKITLILKPIKTDDKR